MRLRQLTCLMNAVEVAAFGDLHQGLALAGRDRGAEVAGGGELVADEAAPGRHWDHSPWGWTLRPRHPSGVILVGSRWLNSAIRTTRPGCSFDVKIPSWHTCGDGGRGCVAPCRRSATPATVSAAVWLAQPHGQSHATAPTRANPGGAEHRCDARPRCGDRGAACGQEMPDGLLRPGPAHLPTTLRIGLTSLSERRRALCAGRRRCRSRPRWG